VQTLHAIDRDGLGLMHTESELSTERTPGAISALCTAGSLNARDIDNSSFGCASPINNRGW
jgi:hypothetical protein